MEGSWSGPGGGGYREYFLVKQLHRDLGKKSFLLFGTGNTTTFSRLRSEGIDVTGCDISQDVVAYKKKEHGDQSFFTPETIPSDAKYDAIVAVEVFEHFVDPLASWRLLMSKLADGGIVCGTTDFYRGGSIEDDNKPGYMSLKGHVAYWSERSMSTLAARSDYAVAAFELVRPGSVLPDERFGQLWPNKRVFFIHPLGHAQYFQTLYEQTPILPIDRP